MKYYTGSNVPESGIYKVKHKAHRLPHEVTLLKGQQFPTCSRCKDKVEFEVVRTIAELSERRERIILNELPEMHDDEVA